MLTSTNERIVTEFESKRNEIISEYEVKTPEIVTRFDNGVFSIVFTDEYAVHCSLGFTVDLTGVTLEDLNNLGINRPDLKTLFKAYLETVEIEGNAGNCFDEVEFADFNEEISAIVDKCKDNSREFKRIVDENDINKNFNAPYSLTKSDKDYLWTKGSRELIVQLAKTREILH